MKGEWERCCLARTVVWDGRPPSRSCLLNSVRVWTDGSYKDGACGSGFVVFGSPAPGPMDDNWDMIAWMSFGVEADSITAAELEAVAAAHHFVAHLLDNPQDWHAFFSQYKP